MKLSSHWIREFVDVAADDRQLAADLTDIGLGVEGMEVSGADTIFEVEIGTNRPDAMNHYGVAREAAAFYNLPLKPLPALSHDPATQGKAFPIEIKEPSLCPRFSGRVIRNVRIQASPDHVADRLRLLDQRPINNAVDATNYVLWEIGKPTHVFDLDLIEGGKLIIRRANAGEKLKTLDGVERTLTSDDLVVADAKKAVALAGVMGGFDTMITEKTRNVLIESAWFDPASVRAASRRHGLHTDASHRFERGADFESTPISCDRVAQLILDSGGGELEGGIVDIVARVMEQAPITLRLREVDRILGKGIQTAEISRILQRLGCELIPAGDKDVEFVVRVPSWRLDIEREIDLIEEIARLYGYNRFSNTLPAYSGEVVESAEAEKSRVLRSRALALGYDEAVSLSFISHADAETFSATRLLELENPQSEEASVMRSTLVPGMLDMIGWNLNRDADDVRLFELGETFEFRGEKRAEPKRACLGATVASLRNSLPRSEALDASKGPAAEAAEAFRCIKGDVENLLRRFESGKLSFDRQTPDYYHRGRSARALIQGEAVAQFGQLSPAIAAARKLRQDVYLAEIDLERLYLLPLRHARSAVLAKYPSVERDFSFVFSDAVTFADMERAATKLGIAELRAFRPAEIFRGGSVPAGSYSVLLRVTLQSDEGTLRDDQITSASTKIVTALQELGGTQRV